MRSGQGEADTLPHGDARSFFDAIAGHYDRVYALDGEEHRVRMRAVVRALGPPCEVLILGVGTGRELPALLDAGFRTTGVDCSDEMLARCALRSRHGVLLRGDFWEKLPTAPHAFGAAIALHGTFAHPPDVDAIGRAAGNLARALVPGGTLYIELPTRAWFARWAAAASGGPGSLIVDDDEAVFIDRRTGAALRGRIVDPEAWLAPLEPYFACTLQRMSDDESAIVAVRRDGRPAAR